MEITKQDWKLYREKLPLWQEAYMEKLCKEYAEFLLSDKEASSKFWELRDRINADRKRPGVLAEMRKSNVVFDLAKLMHDGAITKEDLEGFSEDLIESVDRLLSINS